MHMGEGRYESIAVVRPPTVIDDALKKTCCMNVVKVVKTLDLGMIWDWLPMAFPLDKAYADSDTFTKKVFMGINRYPLEEWKKTDRPFMAECCCQQERWISLL